jgi:GntR family transcriptional regulator
MVSRASGRPAYLQIADALREQINAGRYPPGAQLPTERALQDEYRVSSRTVRVALDQLRAEGLAVSYQGRGVFVREQAVPRRLSTDIAVFDGWYQTLRRQGLKPAGRTTVTRAPCPPDAAEWLGIEPGTEVLVRDRVMHAEGHPPEMLATSYFPLWVVERAPKLADPGVGGMPRWLREAFGTFYSEDVITARMPTQAERERLDLPPGVPVLVIKGGEHDSDSQRPLHYIEVVAAGGRIEFAYRYGTDPGDEPDSDG